MIYHDYVAQLLFEGQKRKLDYVTQYGWQFSHTKKTAEPLHALPRTAIHAQQSCCATC